MRAHVFFPKRANRRVFLFIFSGEYFLVLLLLQRTHTDSYVDGGRDVELEVVRIRKERENTKERDGECY